jgi:hypothetical protein
MKPFKALLFLSSSSLVLFSRSTICYAFDVKPVIPFDASYLFNKDFCSVGNPERYCSSYSLQQSGWGTLTVNAPALKVLTPPKADSAVMEVLRKSSWTQGAMGSTPWTFETSTKSLEGELEILKYKPFVNRGADIKGLIPSIPGPGDEPVIFGLTGTVGGYLRAKFLPLGNDPKPLIYNNPQANTFHWIQFVSSNHAAIIVGNGVPTATYGAKETNKVDVTTQQMNPSNATSVFNTPDGRLFTPFYDTVYNKNIPDGEFVDYSYRTTDITEPHDWTAQLYLAEEYQPNKVRIYDGIEWGWNSSFTKGTQAALPADIPSSGSPTSPKRPSYACGRGWPISCCTPWGLDYSTNGVVSKGTLSLDPEFQDNSIYENNATTDPTAVPSPALLPTLATAGIYHGRKWRKRKQAKKDNDIAA